MHQELTSIDKYPDVPGTWFCPEETDKNKGTHVKCGILREQGEYSEGIQAFLCAGP